MKVYNFKQLKQALKTESIIYIMQDIYAETSIKLCKDNVKIIGVLNQGKLPILDLNLNNIICIKSNNCLMKNLIIENSIDCGLRIRAGHNNTIVNCIFRYNNNSGLSITDKSNNNKIINCFSYMNCDYKNFGKSADGFSCKLQAGAINKFINCYSFENSDDGFDNYDNFNAVYYINCIAWNNGNKNLFNKFIHNDWKGNGNGFKLASINVGKNAYRYIKNCIAFNNTMKGFDQNNGKFRIDIKNCIAFNNSTNYKLQDAVLLSDDNNSESYNQQIIDFCNKIKTMCEMNLVIDKVNF